MSAITNMTGDMQTAVTAGSKAGQVDSIQDSAVFAQQLGNLLLNLDEQGMSEVAPGMDPDDVSKLQDLLALLQQMMSQGVALQTNQQPLDNQGDQQGIQLHIDQLPTVASKLRTDLQQMLNNMSLSEGGDTLEQAQTLVSQIDELISKLNSDAKGNKSANKGMPTTSVPPKIGAFQAVAVQSDSPAMVMKTRQALSLYQLEAGTNCRATTVTSEQWNPTLAIQADNSESGVEDAKLQPGQQVTGQPIPVNGRMDGPAQPKEFSVRADRFAQEVSNVFVKQMKVGSFQGVSEAKLILHPQSLGQVNVLITSHNGMITAHFQADTQIGKEALDNQLSQLRQALVQQGLQVDKLDVTHQPQSQSQTFDFTQQRGQSQQQQRQQQESGNGNDQQTEFSLEALTEKDGPSTGTSRNGSIANVDFSA